MTRVQMMYFGKRVEVDADQAKMLEQKQTAVNAVTYLNGQAKNRKLNASELALLDKHMGKIQRLNRKLRQNVTQVY